MGPCGRKLEAGEGQGQEQWGRLTDDDLDVIAGKRDQLEGKIQERYGIEKAKAKGKAKIEVDDWFTKYDARR